jgi:uncharacterized membrane protein YphA (DoxX/SURF4 family)
MNIVLWVLQGLAAAAFLGSGLLKLGRPIPELAKNMTWVTHFQPPMVKLVGAVEVLGAIGLILPWATGIATVLTPIAAVGLAVTMIGALVTHARIKDAATLYVPAAVLLIIDAVIAIGRF